MATVMNCSVRFGRLCPLRRKGLVPTADETVRRCETCWRLVFLWMTDTGGAGSQVGAPGRCNVDPIMKQFGFLTCTDDCTTPPSGSSNLCSKTPFPTIPSTPAACTPTNSAGGPTWNYGQVACTGTNLCCSNNLACNAQPAGTPAGFCAAATGRPINSSCSAAGGQAECATGSTCTDLGGGLLACQ